MGDCNVHGCSSKASKRGWCNAHYLRNWKYGSPTAGSTRHGEAQRFVFETAIPHQGDDCLIWPFSAVKGYGQFRFGGKLYLVTRFVCEASKGPPPFEGAEAAHSCGNGHLGCCSPNHLRWATRKENIEDMFIHGTTNKGKSIKSNRLSSKAKSDLIASIPTKSNNHLSKEFGITPSAVQYYRNRMQ